MTTLASSYLIVFFILAGKEDNHKILNGFFLATSDQGLKSYLPLSV